MLDLTFGEQVKIVLSRKGMTIKELAELIEESTGMKMSRQNLTQRLSRDNFQEQDMRMIAAILERPIHLSILEDDGPISELPQKKVEEKSEKTERKQKIENVVPEPVVEEPEEVPEQEVSPEDGFEEEVFEEELFEEEIAKPVEDMNYINVEDIEDTEDAGPEEKAYSVDELLAEIDALEAETRAVQEGEPVMQKKEKSRGWEFPLHRKKQVQPEEVAVEDVIHEDVLVEDVLQEALDEEEDTELGDVNPYTGREYKTNSVRVHPDRIGYVQVYDRGEHKWTDMTEWAFLGYQERKKALLGKDYEPPIYLD